MVKREALLLSTGANKTGIFLEYKEPKEKPMRSYNSFFSRSDRYGNYITEESKVEELIRRLKYPLEDILRAIQEVGFDIHEVEEYIRDRYNRS